MPDWMRLSATRCRLLPFYHAATLAIENAPAFINRGEAGTLRHLLVFLETRRLSQDTELRLLEARGDLELLLGDLKDARQTFSTTAGRASDVLQRARLWRKLGEVQARLGEYEEALATFERGREALCDVPEAQGEDAQITVGITTVLLNQGENDAALAEVKPVLEALDQQQFPEPAADLNDVVGKAYYFEQDFSSALVHFQAALDLRLYQQDRQGILKSYSNLAIVHGHRNRYADSTQANEAALEIAEQIGDLVAISTLYRKLSICRLRQLPPTGQIIRLPGDELCVIRYQKTDQLGYIIGYAQPSHGDAIGQVFGHGLWLHPHDHAFQHHAPLLHGRVHIARQHRVDRDPRLAHFLSQ